MGQALYDAQLEYFRTHEFYNDESISPFLHSMTRAKEPVLHRLEVTQSTESPRLSLKAGRYTPEDMEYSKSVDDIEDHYIHQVEVKNRLMERAPYQIFHPNAISSIQGSVNRRGTGWVILLNPKTFERIVEASLELGDIWDGDPAPKVPRQIGRWTLAGNKPDRCQHYWTADHVAEDEIISAYRSADLAAQSDGLSILPLDDGFYYPRGGLQGYIMRTRLIA